MRRQYFIPLWKFKIHFIMAHFGVCVCLMCSMQMHIFSRSRLHLIAYAARPHEIMNAPFFNGKARSSAFLHEIILKTGKNSLQSPDHKLRGKRQTMCMRASSIWCEMCMSVRYQLKRVNKINISSWFWALHENSLGFLLCTLHNTNDQWPTPTIY